MSLAQVKSWEDALIEVEHGWFLVEDIRRKRGFDSSWRSKALLLSSTSENYSKIETRSMAGEKLVEKEESIGQFIQQDELEVDVMKKEFEINVKKD